MTTPSSCETFLLLCCVLLPSLHASCPSRCVNGHTVQGCKCSTKCSGEIYWYLRQGINNCDRCTPKCSAAYNLIEVTSCTLDHNRVCKCKPGFYCTRGNDYVTHCHKPCVPCAPGTFSSAPSLNSTCTPHTDCAQLGKVVLREGTASYDRTCGHLMTTPTTMATPTPVITALSSTTATTSSASTTTNPTKPPISSLLLTNSEPHSDREATQTQQLYSRSTAEATSAPNTSSNTGGNLALMEQDSAWTEKLLLLLVLLILLLATAGFCMLRKSSAKKSLSKHPGFIPRNHKDPDQKQSKAAHHSSLTLTEHNRCVQAELPLSSEVRGQNVGVTPHSGGGQQVSMEHNVTGENISNTVGSIYIYSPGMVILGSNKKEEAGISEEDVPLISTPQQESTAPSEEVRIRMSAQEEDLSLSFPVPATGK